NLIPVAALLVHEYAHSEDSAGQRSGTTEVNARMAQMQMYGIWLGKGTINRATFMHLYSDLMYNASFTTPFALDIIARSLFMPMAMAWMPEMHQHTDLAAQTYRGIATPYYQGLWGLEANPKGPAATPHMPPK